MVKALSSVGEDVSKSKLQLADADRRVSETAARARAGT